jgi:hypothetical protein
MEGLEGVEEVWATRHPAQTWGALRCVTSDSFFELSALRGPYP